jgi:PhnB protein
MNADPARSVQQISLVPFLSVRNSWRAVEFYQAAFGAVEVYRMEDPAHGVVSRLSIAGAEFWLSEEAPDFGNFSPETLRGSTTRMILTVGDPEAVFARALAAGATEVYPIVVEHGWKLGRILDPYGHHWEIGHPV